MVAEQNEPIHIEFQALNPKLGTSYAHGHLTDVSGKKRVFKNIDFSYSVITRGYFHQAGFEHCKFVGARLVDCNFRNANFEDCDFSYANLKGCRIETGEILRNLPERPNVRRELLQILRKNALSMGNVTAERDFVIAELAAKKEHLRKAWLQNEIYYREKYAGFAKCSYVLIQRFLLWLDSFFWGHGEKPWRLLIVMLGILFIIALGSSLSEIVSGIELVNSFLKYLAYYVCLFLDIPHESGVNQLIIVDGVVVICRYIGWGLLVSSLFRWFSHR